MKEDKLIRKYLFRVFSLAEMYSLLKERSQNVAASFGTMKMLGIFATIVNVRNTWLFTKNLFFKKKKEKL